MATRIVSCRAIGVAHRARTSRGEYHGAGSLTQDGRWEYSWDAENRLIRVQSQTDTPQASWRTVQWQYDALGRRIRETTWTWNANSGTWEATEDLKFVSEATLFGRRIAELNASDSALVRTYVWGLDLSGTEQGAGGVGGLLWLTQHAGPNTGTHFAAYDGNGNIVALSAASDGSETARYEYGPFGEPIRVSGPAASLNPFRFSTKRTENNTDLVLYEYRAYSPSLGRFSNSDPIGELGGLNLYGFVGNNPMGRVDTDGRAWWPPSEWPIWPKPKPKPSVKPPKKPKDKCTDCDKQDNPAKELFKMAADTLAGEVGGKAGGIVRLLLLASDAKKGCGDMKGAADTCLDFARRQIADPGYPGADTDCQFCCQAIMGSFPGLGGFDYYSCLNICRRF